MLRCAGNAICKMSKPTYYEFFAGGGMARAGLGDGWRCLFANDFDAKKAQTYRENWGDEELFVGDVRKIATSQLPGRADLVWASFPCQDLSLAGARAGLAGERSGSFWPFFDLMRGLRKEGRAPRIAGLGKCLRNAHLAWRQRFRGDLRSLGGGGLPLWRARHRRGALRAAVATAPLHRRSGRGAAASSRADGTDSQPSPSMRCVCKAPSNGSRNPRGADGSGGGWRRRASAISRSPSSWNARPDGVAWRSEAETQALVSLMNATHRERLAAAQAAGRPAVGAVYRRTRYSPAGEKSQRAEARFDGLSGLPAHACGRLQPTVPALRRGRSGCARG